MKTILDPGHKYILLQLDTMFDSEQILTFIKRCDLEHPERFPGNTNAYPGTTMQAVIRCLIERIDYLDNQIPYENNRAIRKMFLQQLWLLEQRAAERHGYLFNITPLECYTNPMCPHCGHVICEQLDNAHPI